MQFLIRHIFIQNEGNGGKAIVLRIKADTQEFFIFVEVFIFSSLITYSDVIRVKEYADKMKISSLRLIVLEITIHLVVLIEDRAIIIFTLRFFFNIRHLITIEEEAVIIRNKFLFFMVEASIRKVGIIFCHVRRVRVDGISNLSIFMIFRNQNCHGQIPNFIVSAISRINFVSWSGKIIVSKMAREEITWIA